MLVQLRSFLAVVEEGSLHRAAGRLRMSQSALSRQMQALEAELGGRLLERTSSGVRPTAGGYALAARLPAVLQAYDATMSEARQLVRGESEQIRIGYLASAASKYLIPALEALRRTFPDVKLKLLDTSPGEQIAALRRGELDLALTDGSGSLLAREFYARKLASVRSVVALPSHHQLAVRAEVEIADLRQETFIGGPEAHLPGYNRRLAEICRKQGDFRPKMFAHAGTLDDGLALVANEEIIALLPAYVLGHRAPGVVMVPIADPEATWDLYLVWQRGQASPFLRALIDLIGSIAGHSELTLQSAGKVGSPLISATADA